jgi:hypothetical protein
MYIALSWRNCRQRRERERDTGDKVQGLCEENALPHWPSHRQCVYSSRYREMFSKKYRSTTRRGRYRSTSMLLRASIRQHSYFYPHPHPHQYKPTRDNSSLLSGRIGQRRCNISCCIHFYFGLHLQCGPNAHTVWDCSRNGNAGSNPVGSSPAYISRKTCVPCTLEVSEKWEG